MLGIRAKVAKSLLALASILAAGALGPAATPASAATGYTTSAYVNVREAPSTSARLIGGINGGTAISIACQTTGSSFGGSNIWNKLETPHGGYFIHDYFVSQTPYAQFDPRLPRCAAPLATTTSALVNVRSLPTSAAHLVTTIAAGTPIVIACQASGSSFGGSTVWDRLASPHGGAYIHDNFVSGTPHATFDPRIPRCDSTPLFTGLPSRDYGMNLNAYCWSQYPGTTAVPVVLNASDAYSWRCRSFEASLDSSGRRIGLGFQYVYRGIDMQHVCDVQIGGGARVGLRNPADPYSWYCRIA